MSKYDPKPTPDATMAEAPLDRLSRAANLRRVDIAAASGVGMKSIASLSNGRWATTRLGSLCAIAIALGCAPAELIPELAQRPRSGLLYDRGVFSTKSRKTLGHRSTRGG